MIRRYEDKIEYIEYEIPVSVFADVGISLETHAMMLLFYLRWNGNYHNIMEQA